MISKAQLEKRLAEYKNEHATAVAQLNAATSVVYAYNGAIQSIERLIADNGDDGALIHSKTKAPEQYTRP